MIFRTKEDFVKRIKKEIDKLSEEKRVISNSPHLIEEIIMDEPDIIKKRLIIEWNIAIDKKSLFECFEQKNFMENVENTDQKSIEEWTAGEEYRWESEKEE